MRRHISMRITVTAIALGLVACQGDDVSLGDDDDPDDLCGGAMDAEGVSDPDDPNCLPDQGLGIKWNGSTCEGIAGCECVGADCGELYDTFEDCQAACQFECTSSDTPTPCPDGMYCQAPNNGCGGGYCSPAPTDCQPGNPVCGCDGVTYDDHCEAWRAGVAVAEFNACGQ